MGRGLYANFTNFRKLKPAPPKPCSSRGDEAQIKIGWNEKSESRHLDFYQ